MSVNEPEAVPPAVGPDPIASGKLAEVWQNIIPYSDLNAKGIPERFLALGQEIVPTLAVLAASGNKNPRLLNADAVGRLIATANPLVADTLQSAVGPGDFDFQANSTGNYAPGMLVMLISSTGAGTRWEVRRVIAVQPGNVGAAVFVDVRFRQAYAPGDAILILADPLHDGFLPVERPYDWEVDSDPGTGNQALNTIAGITGLVVLVDAVDATLWGGAGATGGATRVKVIDDPASQATVKWSAICSITGVNSVDRVSRNGLNIRGTVGKAMEIQFDTGIPNSSEIVHMKGWYESVGGSHGTVTTGQFI